MWEHYNNAATTAEGIDTMDLREATTTLLRAADIARWLKLADSYIQAFNRVPESFVLPAEHAVLKPIIESFASDTGAFAKYIRALRDANDGAAFDDLHDLYRTVDMRALQAERRARIRKAVLLLVPMMERAIEREMPYEDHLQAARFVEGRWGMMRLDHLAAERRLRNTKRLPTEERSIALERFWGDIDRALEEGHVPLGDNEEHLAEFIELLRQRRTQ